MRRVRLRLRAWDVVSDAVEAAIGCGLRRARKHVDHPTDEHVAEAVECAVMDALSEVVDWDKSG